jgi:predicted transcriptional regulator
LMMIYMRKYFTIDDMLDKIFKYGLTDTDKTIMEQLTQ